MAFVLVESKSIRVKTNGHHTLVNLGVRPLATTPGETPLYLVTLEEAPAWEPPLATSSP